VAATQRDLQAAVETEEFRADFYHHLRVIQIHLPALRERRDDIPLLVEHLLAHHCRRFGLAMKEFGADAIKVLSRQQWPGNSRELSHVIENSVLQTDGRVLHAPDLSLTRNVNRGSSKVALPDGRTIELDFEQGNPTLEEVEQSILLAAYDYTGHNLSRAARVLGITREALRYRLNKHTGGNQR